MKRRTPKRKKEKGRKRERNGVYTSRKARKNNGRGGKEKENATGQIKHHKRNKWLLLGLRGAVVASAEVRKNTRVYRLGRRFLWGAPGGGKKRRARGRGGDGMCLTQTWGGAQDQLHLRDVATQGVRQKRRIEAQRSTSLIGKNLPGKKHRIPSSSIKVKISQRGKKEGKNKTHSRKRL